MNLWLMVSLRIFIPPARSPAAVVAVADADDEIISTVYTERAIVPHMGSLLQWEPDEGASDRVQIQPLLEGGGPNAKAPAQGGRFQQFASGAGI
jgi:hypothetical protein